MNPKYTLLNDSEDDSPLASIKRHLGLAAGLVVVPIVIVVVLTVIAMSASASLTLQGQALMLDSLKEIPGIPAPHTTLPDGTQCTRIDTKLYNHNGIYYYWLNCNGRRGYVLRSQVR